MPKTMYHKILFLSLVPLLTNASPVEDPLLDDLLQELEQVTAIATHTKLNIDYVPGMVSVLHGKDLIRQGIHTLTEALETIPGIEISISNEGQSHYVMRGIGKSFSSGKVKMLVNGRANNAAMSAATTVSLIPMQIIDRIEVIRGPGSAIYGEYAYAGVVNVVTRKDSQVFYQGGHLNHHTVGLSWSNYGDNKPLSYAFNFSAYDYDGKAVTAGPDYLKSIILPDQLPNAANRTIYLNGISKSPGTSNEVDRILISTLQISYADYQWDSSFAYQHVGDYFGFSNTLPGTVEPIRKIMTATSDIDKSSTLSEDLSLKTSIGTRVYAMRSGLHNFQPAGFPVPGSPGTFFEQGMLGSPNYTEFEARGNLEINFTGLNNHNILAGLHAMAVRQGDTWARRNYSITETGTISALDSVQTFEGSDNWITENNRRMLASFYAQDQWQLFTPLTLTYGGRIDHYLNTGTSINPRAAAVYNFLDNHIFKVQYSRAFRPPTFIEMFAQNNAVATGNPDIASETIQSIEAGYVFNNASTVARATAFYTFMDDLITNRDALYQNLDSVKTEGIEFEFEQKLFGQLFFDFNTTYLRVMDSIANKPLPNIANLLGHSTLRYSPSSQLMFTLNTQYIGSRKRETVDTRGPLAASTFFNFGVSTHNVLIKGINLHLGMKNLLDQALVHPAGLIDFADVKDIPSYANDYPRPGRELWLQISYDL